MPQFLVLVKATPEVEKLDFKPDPSMFEEMGAFNERLKKANAMVTAGGLVASSKIGTRLSWNETNTPQATSGPFSVDNLDSGFWIWDMASFDDAVEWAKQIPLHPAGTQQQSHMHPPISEQTFVPGYF